MYISDFIGKSSFYAEQNVLLFWVITQHFATEWKKNQASVSLLDLMGSNNYNIFFINENTLKASEKNKKFSLYCLWDKPDCKELNGRIKIYHEPKFKQMFFDDLTIDLDHQDIFYFNYRLEWSKIEEKFRIEYSSKTINKLWEIKQRYALYTPSFLKFVNTENAINKLIQQKQKKLAKRREKNVEREKELKRVKIKKSINAIKDIKKSSLFEIYVNREKEIQFIIFSQREKFENFFFDLVNQIPARHPDFKCKLKEFLESENIKVLLPIVDREQHFVQDMYFLYALYSIKYNKVIGFNFEYISNVIGFVSRGYSQYNYLLYRFVCKLNQSKESNIILDKDAHLNESNSQKNDLSITLNTPIIGEILLILFPGCF